MRRSTFFSTPIYLRFGHHDFLYRIYILISNYGSTVHCLHFVLLYSGICIFRFPCKPFGRIHFGRFPSESGESWQSKTHSSLFGALAKEQMLIVLEGHVFGVDQRNSWDTILWIIRNETFSAYGGELEEEL